MNTPLTLLAAQFNPLVGAVRQNSERMQAIIQIHQATHDLIVFPELCLTGYPPEDLLFRDQLHVQITEELRKLAAVVTQCHVIIGHPHRQDGHCYNAASIFFEGKLLTRYFKQKLPNYGVFDEQRYFSKGPETACLLRINDQLIGLCICEDLWQKGPVEALIKAHASLVISINASPFDETKMAQRLEVLQRHAALGVSLVYVNQVGGQDELVFDGQSLAMNAQGKITARLKAFQEAFETLVWNDNSLHGVCIQALSREENLYQALVLALRDYVLKNHFPGVLLGLSGGIDSALTLAIAVDALGASRVHAVLMPSRFTASMSNEDALSQVRALGVKHSILPIEPAFNTLLATLAPSFKDRPADTTEENLQARVRGVLLMALSNKTGSLVLTTSNKSETAVGYATLYGDMAGGFAVLKDVLKTEVYRLAAYRNQLTPVIPERVLTRAPSAELANNQTDQDSLPPYDLLDAILTAYMEENLDEPTLLARGFPREAVQRVVQLIQRNEYKRRQAPTGPKITARAYGREWRYPITSGYEPGPDK